MSHLKEWKEVCDVINSIPRARMSQRNCIGVALLPNSMEGEPGITPMYSPNDQLYWLSVVDLPYRKHRLSSRRTVRLATMFTAQEQYGLPVVRAAANEERWVLDDENEGMDPQILLAIAEISWAMTASCLRKPTMQKWAARVKLPAWTAVAGSSAAWAPRPLTGFLADSEGQLFQQMNYGMGKSQPYYPGVFWDELEWDMTLELPVRAPLSGMLVSVHNDVYYDWPVVALHFQGPVGERVIRASRCLRLAKGTGSTVIVGEQIGEDGFQLDDRWTRGSDRQRVNFLRSVWGTFYDVAMRVWFERQARVFAPGRLYWPSRLVRVQARPPLTTGDFWWDITLALAHWHDGSDVMVPPPIHIHTWDDWRGQLVGDLRYDFSPPESEPEQTPES